MSQHDSTIEAFGLVLLQNCYEIMHDFWICIKCLYKYANYSILNLYF